MDRAQKAETVEALKGVFAGAGVVVVGHYSGLSVADLTVLRSRLRKEGASLKVVKNRLVQRAIDGTPKSAAAKLFTGPTAIAYSEDPISAAKVAVAYAKEKEQFAIIGGLFGDQLLDMQGVQAWPRCLRSTSCVARSSASCRRPRPRSPACSQRRAVSWPGFSTLTRPRTPLNRHFRIHKNTNVRNQDHGKSQ